MERNPKGKMEGEEADQAVRDSHELVIKHGDDINRIIDTIKQDAKQLMSE